MRCLLSSAMAATFAIAPLPAALAAEDRPELERDTLTASVETAPRVLAARAGAEVIGQQRRRQATEGGWRAFGALTGAAVNEIEGNDGNRRYDRLQGDIGVTHPLFGSLSAQRRTLLELERARINAEGRTAEVAREVGREMRASYARYWLSDRRARLAGQWQNQLAGQLESLRPQVGNTLRASEFAEIRSALLIARTDRQEARSQRMTARRELEALLGHEIRPFTPRWPVQSGLCRREGPVFAAALATDPATEAARRELTLLLERADTGIADEVRSNVVLTHSQVLEEWDERGDETSIGITAEIPLGLGQASDARRNLHNAEVLQVQRRLEVARQTLRGRISAALGDLRTTGEARHVVMERLEQARADWLEEQRRLRSGLGRSPMPALRTGVEWYRLASDALVREADWLLARAPLEDIDTPGCQGPAPGAMNGSRLEVPEL